MEKKKGDASFPKGDRPDQSAKGGNENHATRQTLDAGK